jgi:hypothetical protein
MSDRIYNIDTPPHLDDFIRGRGDSKYRCLRPGISQLYTFLCADYSPWLYSRISVNDFESIISFVWMVKESCPPLGIGGNADSMRWYEKRVKDNTRKLLNINLHQYIYAATEEAYIELRCAIILYYIKGSWTWFEAQDYATKLFLSMIFANGYEFIHFSELLNLLNIDSQDIKKRVHFSGDYSIYDFDELHKLKLPKELIGSKLVQKLLQVPLVSRAYYFELLGYNNYSKTLTFTSINSIKYLRYIEHWGIDQIETRSGLVNSGLIKYVTDPFRLLLTKTKNDIIQLLTLHNIDHIKSWSKDRLASIAGELIGEEIVQDNQKRHIVDIPDDLHDDISLSFDYIQKMVPIYQIWLGYGAFRIID